MNAMNIEDDKAAILAVLEAETQAWLRRDLEALAGHWVQSQESRRISSVAHHGIQIQQGWPEIFEAFKILAERYPATFEESRIRRENMNIVVVGDMAWVLYDQIGEKADDDFELAGTQHELKILQRIEGRWKLACGVVLQRAIDHEVCPLIEIDRERNVLWMNAPAHEQISVHQGLITSGSRLRARNRNYEGELQDAVAWANLNRHWRSTDSSTGSRSRPVVLGDNQDAVPMYCWVLVEDGKIIVSFNNHDMAKKRVVLAKSIYGMTDAQGLLAEQLALGGNLAQASANLGVSINTIKTHLQRLYDKTGVRTQSALVGVLLSTEAPTEK